MSMHTLHHTTCLKTSGIPCKKHLIKGPIRHLNKHILKHDNAHNLTIVANQTHQLHKWLENDNIDKILSNDFWTNPAITYKQKHA